MKNNNTISTDEACKILGITRQTLYKLCETGEIPGKKVGSRYKFIKNDIIDYLKGNNDFGEDIQVKDLKGDFSTKGIKKMARRTFQEFASNVEELIVNAYDADATEVRLNIDLDKSQIVISDNGSGMDEQALANYVIYGESEKDSHYKSPQFKRSPIGEYGMGGKLAINNICKQCRIVTRKDGKEYTLNTNRDQLEKASYVSEINSKVYIKSCSQSLKGTTLYMEGISSKNVDLDRLIERLSSKMPISQNFKIIVAYEKQGQKIEHLVKEPEFEFEEKFTFEEHLPMVGDVNLVILFTAQPVPAAKQGIWTKVNGRIVNEKSYWFGIENLSSGHRYKYRLYGVGNADGLKDYVTFAKNDFVDCTEYRSYYEFVHNSLKEVQRKLLKRDEDAKKQRTRDLVKDIEKDINKTVTKLDSPQIIGELEARIKKEFTEEIEDAPTKPYPNFKKVEDEIEKISKSVTRGKDKRKRRNQSASDSKSKYYSGKHYSIDTVDMSKDGDIVKFSKESNLIEINERHPLYENAEKKGGIEILVKNIAFTEIAMDMSDGQPIVFNNVFNELFKLDKDQKQ